MIDPMTALWVGAFCGLLLGYPLGFFVAKSIYRAGAPAGKEVKP